MSVLKYFSHNNNKGLQYNSYATPRTENSTAKIKHKPRQTTIPTQEVIRNEQTIIAPHQKEGECTRIMFSNINGILTSHQEKITEITTFMKKHEIDIMGMAGTNTYWNNGNIYKSMIKKVRKGLDAQKAFLHTSDTHVSWRSNYKPGGTATITNATINSQITKKKQRSSYGKMELYHDRTDRPPHNDYY